MSILYIFVEDFTHFQFEKFYVNFKITGMQNEELFLDSQIWNTAISFQNRK